LIKSDNIGPIRRADLSLRGEYPEFKTTIYRIEENKFLIHIPKIRKRLEAIKRHFKQNIKPILTPVELTNIKPKKYIEIIPSMTDKEISLGLEGLLMSKMDWMKLLVSKFPRINFYKITDDDGVVNIHIANYKEKKGKTTKFIFLDVFNKKALEDFLKSHNSPINFNVIVDNFEQSPDLTPGFDAETGAYIYLKELKQKPHLIQRDEALWFDNVDSIFQGRFKKENLFFYDAEEYSCYVDFSAWSKIIRF